MRRDRTTSVSEAVAAGRELNRSARPLLLSLLWLPLLAAAVSAALDGNRGRHDSCWRNDEDARVLPSVPGLIASWGYESEEHFVTTPDGYELTLHRIPGRGDGGNASTPVLLAHCLIGNSAVFAFAPDALAFQLADAGFDVWMPNARGNTHSRRHSSISPNDKSFWSFGLEEGGLLDLSSSADYVSSVTGHASMHFAGYSMGTTQLLMLLSERPEYNARFRSAHLMGPVAFGGNATNPIVSASNSAEAIQSSLEMVGVRELLPHLGSAQLSAATSVCPLTPELCRAFFAAFLFGMTPDELSGDPRVVANQMAHMPSGASNRQIVHYAQLFRNGGRFARYDWGPTENVAQYGATAPPDYRLDRVRVPTHLYVGAADDLGTPADAEKLSAALGDAAKSLQLVGGDDWGHLHFAFSKRAGREVNAKIVEAMAIDEQRQR